jgi:gamma-glutamyl-gamma-aminobutyrate hydrolase PuuD
MPDIVFEGRTEHHYAAEALNLGANLELGAISEDSSVAMAYATKDGVMYGMQFHPEHYVYGGWAEYNKNILDNFFNIADMYHNYQQKGGQHPSDYLQDAQNVMHQCLL